jgi:ribosomal protein L37AE/L43A
MEDIICPNCKEKFRGTLSKKYLNCLHCRLEFAQKDFDRTIEMSAEEPKISLLERIKSEKQGQ